MVAITNTSLARKGGRKHKGKTNSFYRSASGFFVSKNSHGIEEATKKLLLVSYSKDSGPT